MAIAQYPAQSYNFKYKEKISYFFTFFPYFVPLLSTFVTYLLQGVKIQIFLLGDIKLMMKEDE